MHKACPPGAACRGSSSLRNQARRAAGCERSNGPPPAPQHGGKTERADHERPCARRAQFSTGSCADARRRPAKQRRNQLIMKRIRTIFGAKPLICFAFAFQASEKRKKLSNTFEVPLLLRLLHNEVWRCVR